MNYLDKTLTLLRQNAYFSRDLDWDDLSQKAYAITTDTQTPVACYPAIRMVVEALNDQHSFFIGAEDIQHQGPQGTPLGYGLNILVPEFVVIEVFPNSAGERAGVRRGDVVEQVNGTVPKVNGGRRLHLDPSTPQKLQVCRGGQIIEFEFQAAPIERAPMPIGSYLGDGIGYLELFVQGNPAEAQLYIDMAQEAIRNAARAGARAWVVDLRCDRGGNMWPMITGAGPLMGEGLLGKFINADQSTTPWFYKSGTSSYQQPEMETPTAFQTASDPVPTFAPATTPVAVLTSEFTGSSGEMTLISFLGRPNTRTFGGTTTGEITGVAIHELEDGALLGIAESIAADRTGKPYHAAITPDVPMPIDWYRYGKPDDPVIQAAVKWLKNQ